MINSHKIAGFSDSLKIVVINSVYDTIKTSPQVLELFPKIVKLKLEGYEAEYPYGVLPLDTSDFICTHYAVCKKTSTGLTPLMAYRSITWEKCVEHFLEIPALKLARYGTENHIKSISEKLEHLSNQKSRVSYDSSFTIHPSIRNNKDKRDLLKNIMLSMHVLAHQDYDIPYIFAGGVERFKMEKMYHFWGYQDLSWKGEKLPPVYPEFVLKEPTSIFFCDSFSKEGVSIAKEFKSYWDNRIEISKMKKTTEQAA